MRTMPRSGGYISAQPQQPYTKWDTDRDEVEVDYQQMALAQGQNCFSGRKGCLVKMLLGVVIFFIGLIVGYVVRRSVHEALFTKKCGSQAVMRDYSREISVEVTKEISAERIKQNVLNLSRSIHLTGTHDNNVIGSFLHDKLIEYKIPEVRDVSYTALLSYPDYEKPNKISLLAENGSVVYTYTYTKPGYNPEEESRHPDYLPYSAYAANGSVKGEPVYANYGRKQDFNVLKKNNVTCEGKVVIMRYGKIYQGDMVKNAETCGAVGVVFYSDPKDFSRRLPGWAVVRGSILNPAEGDPLSPGVAAVDGIYRLPQSEAGLPKIPVQPMGYSDAFHLLRDMAGTTPHEWMDLAVDGSMDLPYSTGPGYKPSRGHLLVKLDVQNELEDRVITNIVGIIPSDEEPDRYVIVGCHYDAWTKGSNDPNSGTAMLLEIERAFGQLVEKDWRPRRSIVFIHWDGEEQGLVGSYEWVEDHYPELYAGAVAYINLDTSIRGNYTLGGLGSSEIQGAFWNASQMVACTEPDCGAHSLYDQWMERKGPRLSPPTMGSDHQTFLYLAGIPVIFPSFKPHSLTKNIPAFHTALDDVDVLAGSVDPGFHAHVGLSRVVSDVVLRLADSTKLPISCQDLAETLIQEIGKLKKSDRIMNLLRNHSITLDYLDWGIGNFSEAASRFDRDYQDLKFERELDVRVMNDKIMQVSRAFIHAPGLLGRPQVRNLLLAPSVTEATDHIYFTALRDAIDLAESSDDWEEVKKQINYLITAFRKAKHILSNITLLSH